MRHYHLHLLHFTLSYVPCKKDQLGWNNLVISMVTTMFFGWNNHCFWGCYNHTFGCNNHSRHVTAKELVATTRAWLLPCQFQGCFKIETSSDISIWDIIDCHTSYNLDWSNLVVVLHCCRWKCYCSSYLLSCLIVYY